MRGEVRLGFLLYRSWGGGGGGGGGGYERIKTQLGEKGSSNTHFISTATIGVSVVPGYRYQISTATFFLNG